VLYLVMHLATRIWIRIANLVDFSMADAWSRQQDRVREAIARAKPRSALARDARLDDEWVGPWMRQQQRVRDAIAQVNPSHGATDDAELDDEWVTPWIRQQERVREAIAQAKRHSRSDVGRDPTGPRTQQGDL